MCPLTQATKGFLTLQDGSHLKAASSSSSAVVASKPGGGCTPTVGPKGNNPFPTEDQPQATWAGTLGTIAGTAFKYIDVLTQ